MRRDDAARDRRRTTPAGPRRALATLCLTQIVGWGVLYYSFPVTLPAITAETGWSEQSTTAAFSAALVVAAIAGIVIGRTIDHRGPRTVMTTGSIIGVVATLGVAAAPTVPAFTAAWVIAGVAQAGTLYAPAFTALTRWYGPARTRALTVLTLVAGLSSTIFAPTTAALLDHLSWRQTYVVLAILLAVTTIPGHASASPRPGPQSTTAQRTHDAATGTSAPSPPAVPSSASPSPPRWRRSRCSRPPFTSSRCSPTAACP